MTTETIDRVYTPDQHSDIVGGSSAGRVIGCPASVGMLAKLQAQLDAEADAILDGMKGQVMDSEDRQRLEQQAEKLRNSMSESTSYADEGTKLHEVMAYIVNEDIPLNDLLTHEGLDQLYTSLGLPDELFFDAVIPAYRMFDEYCTYLLVESDDPDAELRISVEVQCEMPGIDGAFGTTDILIRAPKRTVVWDWKFGQGVPVYASYKVKRLALPSEIPSEEIGGDETTVDEFGNDQLCFYGRAAVNTFPDYFELGAEIADSSWPVDLVICQPRINPDEVSSFTVTVADLEDFRLDLVDAVTEALGPSPRMKRDDKWCRFAKCKSICPLHFNAPAQLADFGAKLAGLQMAAAASKEGVDSTIHGRDFERAGVSRYSEALAAMLTLAEIVEPYINEARAQAHTFMENGGEVPGYKLVAKRAGWDSWLDEKKTDAYLARQGLSVEERRKPWASITPAVARTKLKALKGKDFDDKAKKQLEKYVKPGVSSGTTLAPADDSRPAIAATPTLIADLGAKIASLSNA